MFVYKCLEIINTKHRLFKIQLLVDCITSPLHRRSGGHPVFNTSILAVYSIADDIAGALGMNILMRGDEPK